MGAVATTPNGISNVWLPGDPHLKTLFSDQFKNSERASHAARQLELYFNRALKSFDIIVDFTTMTIFRQQVLSQLAKVPYGKVITYHQLALQIGSPNASRAVGGAVAANPIPIILPCHRVISSSGAVGGYSGAGGVEMKKYLLSLEGYMDID